MLTENLLISLFLDLVTHIIIHMGQKKKTQMFTTDQL